MKIFFTNNYIIEDNLNADIKVITKNCFKIFFLGSVVIFLFASVSANAYEFPPYMGLGLKVNGTVSEIYSNNITFAKEDENKIEDLMTMLALGMDMKYEVERRTLGLSGQVNRRIRTESSDIQNSSENVNVYFRNEFSKYDRVKLSNIFTHTQLPGSFEIGFDIEECLKTNEELALRQEEIEDICPDCKSL